MQRDPRAFLWDVADAAQAIQTFTHGMDAATYRQSDLVQAAVERKFEVIGEALNQLSKLAPCWPPEFRIWPRLWPSEIN